ncbi:MAG: hypothetical protein NZ891_04420, partial [bacterium]|nr:hypothetical protein [bacterium]MDW8163968.1 hypothetical protein [Candidatus Omnitrophota bacterium]
MKEIEILFVSNGYFEDMMACQIIKHLKKNNPFISFKALPIVGRGFPYILENIPVLGPCITLPSEGLVHFSLKYLLKDIKAGLISSFIKQIKIIKKEGRKADFIIVVGDIFLCALCGFFSGKKVIFASTAQSIYIRKIDRINIWLMKHFAKVVFPRDEKTTLYFKKFGVNAIYFGSLAMDCLEITGENFDIPDGKKIVGLLPGRRNDSYIKLEYLLKVVDRTIIESKNKNYELPIFIIVYSNLFKTEKIMKILKSLNWKFEESNERKRGIIGYLTKNKNSIIISDKFGDVLNKANLIIGFSGASNEQAVGMGKPVITFPIRSNLYPWDFFKKIQQRLLEG